MRALRPIVAVALFFVSAPLVAQDCATERVSVDSDGNQAQTSDLFPAYWPALSADGRYVAFASSAPDLVAGDTNDDIDMFVHDRVTGTTIRVSVDSNGNQGLGGSSSQAGLSVDGSIVAFGSMFSNLVPNDFNANQDAFVHDLRTGVTELVSVNSAGVQGNAWGTRPSMSADGDRVAFSAWSTNLVSGDTNFSVDVFLRDRAAGTTNRVSVSSSGGQSNGRSDYPCLSADSGFVAFASEASNLVAGDTNGVQDIFVHDTATGATRRVSESSGGVEEANDASFDPWISGDGRFVSFSSGATNLVPDDTNGVGDIFVHDLLTGATERVSLGPAGAQSTAGSRRSSISGDGRHVVFASDAPLALEDSNDTSDIYRHDRLTGETTLVSVDASGDEGHQASLFARISADGEHVAFLSHRNDLVPGDTNGSHDVFVHSGSCRPGTAYCFGDGSGAACPCGNVGAMDGGCSNSVGVGSVLRTFGSASVGSDDFVCIANRLPSQPALLFAGQDRVDGGDGAPFGDGLRCAGTAVVRLGVQAAGGDGEATWGPGLAPAGGWSAGDTRRFQVWYRDPIGICGSGFNLSNGAEVVFGT